MDALCEIRRDDDFASPASPAPSMRTALKLAMLLTVLIGLTVLTSVWRVSQVGPALDQPWSLKGPQRGASRAADHLGAGAERFASVDGRTGMCPMLLPIVGGRREGENRDN
jgi:hypothetical protein